MTSNRIPTIVDQLRAEEGDLQGRLDKLRQQCLAFSPDGKRLLTSDREGSAHLWDSTTLKRIGQPLKHPNVNNGVRAGFVVRFVAFSPDGRKIATVGGAGYVGSAQIWDGATQQPIGTSIISAGNFIRANRTIRPMPNQLKLLGI